MRLVGKPGKMPASQIMTIPKRIRARGQGRLLPVAPLNPGRPRLRVVITRHLIYAWHSWASKPGSMADWVRLLAPYTSSLHKAESSLC